MNTIDKNSVKQLVENMILNVSDGSKFTGLTYTNSKGETSQYVININVSYAKAVSKDIEKLQNISSHQIEEIQSKNELFTTEMIQKNVAALLQSFINNQNKETASNQSIAQQTAYINLTPCLKYNFESGLLYLHGAKVSKKVIVPIEYKPVNSRIDTLCKNTIKKVLNFSTEKYRLFTITPDQLKRVKMNGSEWVIE